MTSQSDTLQTFQSVRERAAQFCSDREWEKFHQPTNLVLALAGECGEVCEIFQWKGFLDNKSSEERNAVFTEKELINIGEEIADVFIYTTRLADICHIDLAHATRVAAEMAVTKSSSYEKNATNASGPWDYLTFSDLTEQLTDGDSEGQRQISLSLATSVGKVCELFNHMSENMNQVGLPDWSKRQTTKLSQALGDICCHLSQLAAASDHTLGKCITDKFAKNEAKYPAALVKGSSAKYTEYRENARKLAKNASSSDEKETFIINSDGTKVKAAVVTKDGLTETESMERINRIVSQLPTMVFVIGVLAIILGYVLGRVTF